MTSPSLSVFDLQCEYLTDPLGIDVETPRLGWKIEDCERARGLRQTAYHILVASSPARLSEEQGDLWDSGRVESAQSALVPYGGKKLAAGQDCFWKVRVVDQSGDVSEWSPAARFSTAMLWTGAWIRRPGAGELEHTWFRKKISLEAPAASALIQIASVGYHELYVNGEKVDDRLLSPALTRLDRRVHFVTYDIANRLEAGVNTIAFWTGPGWSRYGYFKTHFALRVQLQVTTEGGEDIPLVSDTSWRCARSNSENTGGWRYDDNGGEKIDARIPEMDWNATGLDDDAWQKAEETSIDATLSAQMMDATRVIEPIPAMSVTGINPCKVVLAKNFTGWLEIKLHGLAKGDEVTIRASDDAETVQECGQSNTFISAGEPEEIFRNRFNFSAGRFLTLEGLKTAPEPGDINGLALATDLQRVGRFTCSKELFTDIYEADLWTYRANTVEGFTMDCPHRERLGYGEECFATAWGIGLPNYRAGAFYTKNIRDWSDMQEADGWIHHTAPQANEHYGGPMWSSAGLNIAWEFYQTYGDTRALECIYPSAKRWLEFLQANVSDGLLRNYASHWGNFLGDWAAPGQRREAGDTPEAEYFNNCVYAMNLARFVDMAGVLGRPDDAALYGKRLATLKGDVHARYFDPARNTYSTGTQVQSAFALLAEITPEALRPAVMANLEHDITEVHPYLDMGSSGLPVLLKFLIEDAERGDLMFGPLSRTTDPSYGYFLARGESTWPEYWDVDVPSRIHTCFTGIASWFIKSLGGIRPDPAAPGYQSFLIKPVLVGDLTFAEATTESPYGAITSRWEREDGRVTLTVTIPPNSQATVYLPTSKPESVSGTEGVEVIGTQDKHVVLKVEAGRYVFGAELSPAA